MKCPHCSEWANIRTSEAVTNLLVRHYFVCSNHLCGHTFVGATEITYTLSPSARPNPAVMLPFSKNVSRSTLTRHLQLAREATDEQLLSSAKVPSSAPDSQAAPGEG
nr:ogr/Delta-like zinc finger family protein [Ottowia sp.]